MASYEILKNQPLVVMLPQDFIDQGWSVSEGVAYHSGCNPGIIKRIFDLSEAGDWTFRYRMGPVTSGGINIIVNGVSGPVHNTPGLKEDTFSVTGDSIEVLFYSDGTNSVEILQVYKSNAEDNSRTFVFNEDINGWGGDHSYKPEYMHKFPNAFFAFKDGELWEQDVNPIHNNFFGEQYTSKVKFVANERPTTNKLWFGIKIDSNGRWSVPSMVTLANETYPNGMESRLHENNFTLDRGNYWSDILRDMLDPQFDNELQSLFEGRVMEGRLLIVEMETKSIDEIKLNAVYLYTSDQERNF